MFCPKCGNEVQEGQAFCGKCGAPVGTAQAGAPAPNTGAGNDEAKAAAGTTPGSPAPKKNGTKIGIAIAAVVVVLLVVVGIATNGFGIGGGKSMVPGSYLAERDGYALSIVVGEEGEVTFNNGEEGLTGTYELHSSSEGNLVFRAQDLMRGDGVAASIDDVQSLFGGYWDDASLEAIYFSVPEGYAEGRAEGIWGVVCQANRPDGTMCTEGNFARINADGTGEYRYVYSDMEAPKALSEENTEGTTEPLEWRKTGPSSYSFSINGNDAVSFTMPTDVMAAEPVASTEENLQENSDQEGSGDSQNADGSVSFEGDWMLSGGTSAGQEVTAADISAMEESGAYVFAQLKSDGSAVLGMYGSSFEGTWKSTDSSSGYLALTGDSGSFEVPLKLEGDQLALDFGGELLLFKKGSIPEEAFTASATTTQNASKFNSYSWAELSQISAEIAAAPSEEEAVSIAAGYGLCSESGPSASETKSIIMADGTQAEVQIIGFAHDVKPDGSKAGITFIFKDAIGEHPMNPTDTNKGGWAGSEMREYLAAQVSNLPEDLQQVIVPVVKMTNNTGETTSTSSVTATEDSLWLLSAVEVSGEGVDKDFGSAIRGNNSGPKMAAIYDLEGTQYPYFKTLLDQDDYKRREFFDKADRDWWSRSPYSVSDDDFKLIGTAGADMQAAADGSSFGVVPCFCI